MTTHRHHPPTALRSARSGIRLRPARPGIRAFLLVLILAAFAPVSIARAGYAESEVWFGALPETERRAIQSDLILLGFYDAFIDGAFGRSTYDALQSFEAGQGAAADGVLEEPSREVLQVKAAAIRKEIGLTDVDDLRSRLQLALPATLLTDIDASSNGTRYASHDDSLVLQTVRILHSAASFADLFASYADPVPGRTVTYSTFSDERFVVSGNEAGRRFYLLFRNGEYSSIGYTLEFTEANRDIGNVLAVYLASNTALLSEPVPAEPAAPKPQPVEATPLPDTFDPDANADARSLLLMASEDGTSGAVGTVVWSTGVDENGWPTLIANANFPTRDLNVLVILSKNADRSMPASHMMEITFTPGDAFEGGSVATLRGVLLKNGEMVQGKALVGASARVVGNVFLFALSAAPLDMADNLAMLAERKWLDLAIIYADGHKAIVTLGKSTLAMDAFAQVLADWEKS